MVSHRLILVSGGGDRPKHAFWIIWIKTTALGVRNLPKEIDIHLMLSSNLQKILHEDSFSRVAGWTIGYTESADYGVAMLLIHF
ncbi:hypothetical protein D3C78_1669870 [compost metagenome]